MRYAIVIEKSETEFGVYVPDLPGCAAAGETVDETERRTQDAVEFHLDGMKDDGPAIPAPSAVAHYVEV